MNGTSDIVNSIGLSQRSSNHLSTLSSFFLSAIKNPYKLLFSLCIYIFSDTRIPTLKRNIMAMVKYSFTRQTTNLARVARMVIGPCSEVLRAVLMKKISPPELNKKFLANDPKTNKVYFKPYLRAIDSEDYSNFDISLLYTLLRHLALLPPPGNGWGKKPDPSDRSVSANIERIRLMRNKYVAHVSGVSFSSSDFKKISKSIIQIIQELETDLGLCTDKQDDVLKLISCMMDSEIEQLYIEKILSESETYPGSKSILYNM